RSATRRRIVAKLGLIAPDVLGGDREAERRERLRRPPAPERERCGRRRRCAPLWLGQPLEPRKRPRGAREDRLHVEAEVVRAVALEERDRLPELGDDPVPVPALGV